MLNFIICDDEKIHNENLKKYITEILSQHQISGKISLCTENPKDVWEYSQTHDNEFGNVYLLDIDFNSDLISGISLARKIRESDRGAYIIFISAHREYTMPSFEIKTFDFLLKPVPLERVEQCLISLYEDYCYYKNHKSRKTISIKAGTMMYIINIGDIYFFEKQRQILITHTKNGVFRSYETLDSMETQLKTQKFYRSHKSYLINLRYVDHLAINTNLVYMTNRAKCLVSRNKKKELLNYLSNSESTLYDQAHMQS